MGESSRNEQHGGGRLLAQNKADANRLNPMTYSYVSEAAFTTTLFKVIKSLQNEEHVITKRSV